MGLSGAQQRCFARQSSVAVQLRNVRFIYHALQFAHALSGTHPATWVEVEQPCGLLNVQQGAVLDRVVQQHVMQLKGHTLLQQTRPHPLRIGAPVRCKA